jgi:hypothetical protein
LIKQLAQRGATAGNGVRGGRGGVRLGLIRKEGGARLVPAAAAGTAIAPERSHAKERLGAVAQHTVH